GAPCESFADCGPGQLCANNEFEAPGGACLTVGCTVGDDATCAAGGDGVCVAAAGVTLCGDGCLVTTDCRAAEGYQCVINPGSRNLCAFVHARPGAACNGDDGCAAGGPWVCLRGAGFPGGYCAGVACDPDDARTCPSGSH